MRRKVTCQSGKLYLRDGHSSLLHYIYVCRFVHLRIGRGCANEYALPALWLILVVVDVPTDPDWEIFQMYVYVAVYGCCRQAVSESVMHCVAQRGRDLLTS